MKLIVGLGNPGKKYHKSRHNAGFMALDFLQKTGDFESWKDSSFFGIISPGRIGGQKVFLFKPTTYMNLSGNAVQKIMHFYKMLPQDILVISDDIDMDFGKVRMRSKGNHGGQNGIRDIIQKIATTEFARIKIGIGRDDRYAVSDWVLSDFQKDELSILEEQIFVQLSERVTQWIQS